MSRYPFRECVNEVMSKYRGNRAASTLEVMERRYNRMERDLDQLRAEGKISTTSPRTRNFPRTKLISFRSYCRSTSCRSNSSRSICIPGRSEMTILR